MKLGRMDIAIALLMSVIVMSCEDIGEPADNLSGRYTFTGYDLNGTPVIHGTILLRRDDGTISGEKNLVSEPFACESGTGLVEGEASGASLIRVFLSPAPCLVYIEGSITGETIKGNRFGLPDRAPVMVPEKLGTFQAVRIERE